MVTGIPGKTGVVYTLDRATGEFLWATPTITQNVISDIDGATGAVSENGELVFSAEGQEVLACPTYNGGKDWEAGAYSPLTNTMYFPLRNTCARMMTVTSSETLPLELYSLAVRNQIAPGTDQVGTVQAISAETGATVWKHDQRAATTSLVTTGGGLVFGGDANGRFRAFDQETGEVLWEINIGSSVSGFPDHLRGRRPAVRRGQHGDGQPDVLPPADARAAPEHRQQHLRLRAAVGPSPSRRSRGRGRHPDKALSAAFVRSAPPGRHARGAVCTCSSSQPAPEAGSSGSSSAADAANSGSAPSRSSRSPRPASRPSPTACWPARAVTPSRRHAAPMALRPSPKPPNACSNRSAAAGRGRWHAQNWIRSMERHVVPRIGSRAVSEVNTADEPEILSPIWHVKAATARGGPPAHPISAYPGRDSH